MLEFYGRKFTCDECPICEGIEHRVRVARGVATNRSLNTAVAIKSRLNFLSVVIVAMLLRRTSRMANCVNREKPGEHIGARCANRRKRKS